jgi:ribosome-associated protein
MSRRPAPSFDAPLDPEPSDDEDRPSKSQRKRDSHELQALGEALVGLPDDRIEAIGLDDRLLGAVQEYKRTRSFEGRRRQMQYIGKLMRLNDVEPIREAVTAMQLGQAKDALALHESEHWRQVLIDSDDALTRWTAEHPASDLQQLRSLIRAARKDAAAAPEQRSGRAYRELFQYIKAQRLQVQQAQAADHARAEDDDE